ncbi:DUF4396 domain-containing protein [Calidifontibacter sp. DB0510]|uniref:DUF4396 domain-containing protein n=1 Tax=Metallococcus carri TaxID=1656884 RepID=A0A967B6L5_9MICO|nr:DUF4396 domain-containing protein [Metallococcus carri]NHN55646.1 DUF4396 domain-containing protein [Metallococcus carri]NOP38170.1 DUF4396 domain-containing protein [Calidifontibacter sp. DB2511S]
MTSAHEHTDHGMSAHAGHDMSGHHDMSGSALNSMAASATLHCLVGCAIGEIAGLIIGTAAGWSNLPTTVLSIALAFVFGFALSSLPLLKAGLGLGAALSVVVAADTLSIATMEIVDNLVMLVIPGAMNAGVVNAIFWISMAIALTVAFFAAYPVNRYLLRRGKGHALTHEYHSASKDAQGARRFIPDPPAPVLAAVIAAFMLGGLLVSAADDLGIGSGHPNATAVAPSRS